MIDPQIMSTARYHAMVGDVYHLQKKMNEFNIPVDHEDETGSTMLECAILFSRYEVIEFLLKMGANVNRISETHRFTPIETCLYCVGYKPRTFQLLCWYGADVFTTSAKTYIPIYDECVKYPKQAESSYILKMPMRLSIIQMIIGYNKGTFPLCHELIRLLYSYF
jgi:hypothetical protein